MTAVDKYFYGKRKNVDVDYQRITAPRRINGQAFCFHGYPD